tara:strand:+ start:32156 stop:32560 length:405 start_codon:yes stop_codon:yes gene_type:complete
MAKKNKLKVVESIDAKVDETPIVASVRTGLAGPNEAILNRLPFDYAGKTVSQVINYLLDNNSEREKVSLAQSIKGELAADGSIILINGKQAKLQNQLNDYVKLEDHQLPDGNVVKYKQFEIEISAVQQGGYLGL